MKKERLASFKKQLAREAAAARRRSRSHRALRQGSGRRLHQGSRATRRTPPTPGSSSSSWATATGDCCATSWPRCRRSTTARSATASAAARPSATSASRRCRSPATASTASVWSRKRSAPPPADAPPRPGLVARSPLHDCLPPDAVRHARASRSPSWLRGRPPARAGDDDPQARRRDAPRATRRGAAGRDRGGAHPLSLRPAALARPRRRAARAARSRHRRRATGTRPSAHPAAAAGGRAAGRPRDRVRVARGRATTSSGALELARGDAAGAAIAHFKAAAARRSRLPAGRARARRRLRGRRRSPRGGAHVGARGRDASRRCRCWRGSSARTGGRAGRAG